MKRFTKISAVFLAFMLLLSTFTFAVEKHFCGDFLVDVSIMGKAKSCNDSMSSKDVVQMKKCCKDEVNHIEGQDELQQQKISLDIVKQQFVVAFVYTYQTNFLEEFTNNIFYTDTSPPFENRDYQVEYQTFLL